MKIYNKLPHTEFKEIAEEKSFATPDEALMYYQDLMRFLNTALYEAVQEAAQEEVKEDNNSNQKFDIDELIVLCKAVLSKADQLSLFFSPSKAIYYFNLANLIFARNAPVNMLSTLKTTLIAEPQPLQDSDTPLAKKAIQTMLSRVNVQSFTPSNHSKYLRNALITYLHFAFNNKIEHEDREIIYKIASSYVSKSAKLIDIETLDMLLHFLNGYGDASDIRWNLTFISLSKILMISTNHATLTKCYNTLQNRLNCIDPEDFDLNYEVIYKGLIFYHVKMEKFKEADDTRLTAISVLKAVGKISEIEYFETTLKKQMTDARLKHLNSCNVQPTFMHSNIKPAPSAPAPGKENMPVNMITADANGRVTDSKKRKAPTSPRL